MSDKKEDALEREYLLNIVEEENGVVSAGVQPP